MKRLVFVLCVLSGCNHLNQGGGGLPQPVAKVDAKAPGLLTTLDASDSIDPAGGTLTYEWKILQPPAGSTVTSVASPTQAKTALAADVGGIYKVRLSVRSSKGDTNAAFLDVDVPAPPIYYLGTDVTGDMTTFKPSVVHSDATADHQIDCPSSINMGTGSNNEVIPTYPILSGLVGSRVSADGRYAFSKLAISSTSISSTLYLASPDSSCASQQPPRIDTLAATLTSNPTTALFPRFSPNGQRIAYIGLDFSMGAAYLISLKTTGEDAHVVRQYFASSVTVIPPVWIDDANLAWAEANFGSPSSIVIFRGQDQKNVLPTKIHDCSGVFATLGSFAILPGNQILFSAAVQSRAAGGANNLYRNTLGNCSVAPALTDENTQFYAGDFTVSSDGSQVLFAWDEGTTVDPQQPPLTDIYLAPTDGSSGPTKIAGDPAMIDVAPRFLPGEEQFTWTSMTPNSDSLPSSSTLWVANLDGSHAHQVKSSTAVANEIHVVLGSSNLGGTCEMAVGASPAGRGALFLSALLLLGSGIVRRRAIRVRSGGRQS